MKPDEYDPNCLASVPPPHFFFSTTFLYLVFLPASHMLRTPRVGLSQRWEGAAGRCAAQAARLLESRNVGMERWPNRRVKYHMGKLRREKKHAKLTKPGDDINPNEELITGFCCYMDRWVDMLNNRERKRTFVRLWVKLWRGKEGIKDVSWLIKKKNF